MTKRIEVVYRRQSEHETEHSSERRSVCRDGAKVCRNRHQPRHGRARTQVRQQPHDHLRERPDQDHQHQPPDQGQPDPRRRHHPQAEPRQGQAADEARVVRQVADHRLRQPAGHQQGLGQGSRQGRQVHQEDQHRLPHRHQAGRDRRDLLGHGRPGDQGREAIARHRRVAHANKYRRS